MKHKKYQIVLKDIKIRHHFAPATKKINSKKIYKRSKNKLACYRTSLRVLAKEYILIV